MNKTPYENLDPSVILDAVDSVGFRTSGSLFALNSYENRVYQVGIEESAPMIAKFYRPERWTDAMILEEHQFALELAAKEIPVIAPWMNFEKKTLHSYQDFRFALFPRLVGRPLELDNLEQLEWMGRFIGRLHAVSACRAFKHRSTLTVETYGIQPFEFLIKNNFIPEYLKEKYISTIETLLPLIKQRFQQIDMLKSIRLHGDVHVGNILWNDTGPHIVDLDDCLMGPSVQDIWMLLSGNEMQMELELDYILKGYMEFHDFNYQELGLVESLRTLRMIYYSGWLARRWEDPAFPRSFPWFNTPHYWQEQLQNLNEQLNFFQES